MCQKFFDLVKGALPHGLNPKELVELAPQKWWEEKSYLAAAYALRKCARINWDAYLDNYPDVKNSGMDACLHFLRHGVYEGRKLFACNRGMQTGSAPGPLVSIIVINFNNAHFLNKCLDSVINQTLKNIEIIIVDDCSTDNSRAVIQGYANKDARIRLIVNKQNSATLITRKRGVEAAAGRYVMLLDSDDYMTANACEIAVREISKGYDMVKFGAHVVNSMNAQRAEIEDNINFCNRGDPGEYFNDEIVTTIFREGKMSWHVWSFIYLREICQAAFAELPDEYITGPDDLYALLAIARRAGSLLKIDDKLIYYNYGPGVSVTVNKHKVIKYAHARAGAIKAIQRYANQYSLNIGINTLYKNLCADLLDKLLAVAGDEETACCFDKLVGMLGFKYVLEALFLRHYDKAAKIASLLSPAPPRSSMRHIGIFFPKLHYGGMETIIISISSIMKANGYNVTLFLEECSDRDVALNSGVEIYYIGSFTRDFIFFSKRLANFERAIVTSHIDVLLYFAPHTSAILWDAMLLRHMLIPVIPWLRFNFDWSFGSGKAPTRSVKEKIFRNADAVICQSNIEELYLRLRGINAMFLPAPLAMRPCCQRDDIPARIAILGRLGDPFKQIGEALEVLRVATSKAPWITACFIGDFYTPEQLKSFRLKLREYGLHKNVIVTGWTDKPEIFLKDCGILLSVSACEAFGIGIAEAQRAGLPCVIYDVPIEQAINNPAIIVVPQGDHEAAASEIIAILDNPEKWRRLSNIAREHSNEWGADKFANKLKHLLDNFQTSSPIKQYARNDYERIINYAAFYSGRNFESSL